MSAEKETRTAAIRAEALDRAKHGQSVSNYASIYAGFVAKGIPEAEILPRVNVFTFDAWRAQGRVVRKGEHGVKVTTFIDATGKPDEEGERPTYRRPRTTTVFHISQTDPEAS